MIYIETETVNVYKNFAYELYYATNYTEIFDDTVFMFWRTTPTVMVGKYQNVYKEVNLPYITEHDIKLVRRMSGGGAIYTDLGGFQYTFIQKNNNGNEISFSEYIPPIVAALKSLGLNVEFSGRNDLLIDGRKISGNAQYKLGDITVHHGSLLFDTDFSNMISAITVDSYKIISKGIDSVRERVTNISEHLTEKISPLEFKDRFLAEILGNNSQIYRPSLEEAKIIETISREKFENHDIIFMPNKSFEKIKTCRFPGGSFEFSLNIRDNRIQDISITGDYFASADDICRTLIGCEFTTEAVFVALSKGGISIFGVDLHELAKAIAE